MRNKTVSKMVKIAMFGTLSFLFFFLKFPILPSFPFLEIQFSNLPAIIAGFAMGPISGCVVVVVRTLLKIVFIPSTTGYVGELADFLIGVSVITVTSLIYMKHKSKKGGAVSLLFGCLTWIVVSVIFNWTLLGPLYGLKGKVLINYVLAGALPFNAILSTMVSLLTFIIYKRISILLQKF